jgi:hypothetical protein
MGERARICIIVSEFFSGVLKTDPVVFAKRFVGRPQACGASQ